MPEVSALEDWPENVTAEFIKGYAMGLRDMEGSANRAFGLTASPEMLRQVLMDVGQTLIERAPDPAPREPREDAISEVDVLREGIHTVEAENERLRTTVEGKNKSLEFWMTTPCSATLSDVRIKTLEEQAELLKNYARQAEQQRQHTVKSMLVMVVDRLIDRIVDERKTAAQARVNEAQSNLASPDKIDPALRGGRLANMRMQERITDVILKHPGWRASKVVAALYALLDEVDEHNEQMLQSMRDRAKQEYDRAHEELTRVNRS